MEVVTPRERWETRTAVPLICLGLVFLAAFAVEVLWVDAPRGTRLALRAAQIAIWLMFIVDYAVRFSLSTTRWDFVRRSWIDFGAVLLPALRPLSPLALLGVVHRAGRTRARRSAVVYASGTTALIFTVCSLGVLNAERGHRGANIQTLGDATWWAAVTVATVGYGDRYPVTLEGRMIALVLMATGVALLGLVIANVAAWFIERFGIDELNEEQKQLGIAEPASHPEGLVLAALVAQVTELRAEVAALHGQLRQAERQAEREEGGARSPAEPSPGPTVRLPTEPDRLQSEPDRRSAGLMSD